MVLTAFLPYSNERFRHNHVARRRRTHNRRRHVLSPRLQLLEDRTLLSTFTVTDNSDNPTDPGSLRYAILHEPSGTTINFASTLTSPITLTNGVLDITTNLDIEGPGAGKLTISGNKNVLRNLIGGVFEVAGGVSATIGGLTIANGQAVGGGGGIYNSGTLTVDDSTLSSNWCDTFGGGIFNKGKLTVTDCTLSRNLAVGFGGGIYNEGTLTVTDSTLSGNTATYSYGGGIANFGPGKLTVTYSTLSSNKAGDGGGGVYDLNGSATLTRCTLSGNTAVRGGGVYNVAGTVMLTRCTLSGNTAGGGSGGNYGGGIDNDLGTLTVTDCTLSSNKAGDYGGGIYTENTGMLTVTDCTLSSNSADLDGGGIFASGTLTVTDCTLSSNTAGAGGGVYNVVSARLTNCTVSGNSASDTGGGIDAFSGSLRLTNCTVSGNSASETGGGIKGAVTLANTIVAGNMLTGSHGSGPDVNGKVISLGYNLIGNTSGSSGWLSTDLQNQNPLLSVLGNYGGPTQTMALLPDSPAIGTGSAAITGVTLPTTDQRGDPRTTFGALDIGAFQSHGFKIKVYSGNNQSATSNTAFAAPLVVLVTSAFGEPVEGGLVSFTAPDSGASATFSGGINTVSIGGSNRASINLSANTIAGGRYIVQATTNGASDAADFSLTNTP